MNKLKVLDGSEIWTNAFGDRFGERVCVLVRYPFLVNNGVKFKPTQTEVIELWNDYIIQEFGPKEALAKDIEAEFGNGGKK